MAENRESFPNKIAPYKKLQVLFHRNKGAEPQIPIRIDVNHESNFVCVSRHKFDIKKKERDGQTLNPRNQEKARMSRWIAAI
ncbi:hypothetical protein TSUD_381500 [Trifolium subterraneum]|uniref:Uncharacterized protein n=1 Tax=Trifolium subterraneum TaxID=3900 RepID=A0A2Z6MC88_TRISU|nr:hypothetical protein TSUD_381500 [Trifolium subterraneum]